MMIEITLPGFQAPPLKTFQVLDDKKLKELQKLAEKQEEEDNDKKGRGILCKHCRNKITYNAERIEKNGRHKHIFNNPAGYIFEIGCFASAEGCINQGPPTLEFTWFTGFNWRFSMCAACRIHLGWLYQSTVGQGSFYGLILDNLIEESL